MRTKEINYHALVSSCCGAEPKSNGDSDTMDIGICPECGENCEYIEYEPDLPANWEPDYGAGNGAERQEQMHEYQKLK